MTQQITGKTKLYLSKPDASGNVGYCLSFSYQFSKDIPKDSMIYHDIKLNGPDGWDDYSKGEEYPFDEMLNLVMEEEQIKVAYDVVDRLVVKIKEKEIDSKLPF